MEYTLTRSKRKSISLSISRELEVCVKAPLKMSAKDIDAFVNRHSDWILKHINMVQQSNEFRANNVLTKDDITNLKALARKNLPQKVAYFSAVMGVNPSGIKITSALTRWGSCSAKNGLCFPYRLMLLPDYLIDYIVVHELAHIRVKNHSRKFYDEVSKYMPDYKQRVAKLKQIQT